MVVLGLNYLEFKLIIYIFLYFFIFLCYFLCEYYYFIQIVGILWEFFEIYLNKNEDLVFKFGGCLAKKDYKLSQSWYYKYLVVGGQQKYMNPIDKLFGIENS